MKIRSLVAKIVSKYPRNQRRAVKEIFDMAAKNKEVASWLMLLGVKQAVRDFYHDQRRSAMSMASKRAMLPLDERTEKLSARLARIAFWDAYTTFGMSPIGDATRKELIESAEAREQQASDQIRLAKFERAVAARLPNDRARVRDTIDLGSLERIAAKYKAAGDQ
jgi:hypothetical protein